MTAPKAKTLQARFGFSDPELTTPKHDQIMLWLDANIDQVLTDAVGVEYVETHIGDGLTYSMIHNKLESLLHDAVKIEKEMYAIDSLHIDEDPAILGIIYQFQESTDWIKRQNSDPRLVQIDDSDDKKASRLNQHEKYLSEKRQEIQQKRQDKIAAAKEKLSKIEEYRQLLLSKRACEIVPPTPDEWMVRHTSKVWEKPIVSESARTSYTIGFVDMVVKYAKPKHFMNYNNESQSADFSVVQSGSCGTVYFEVKPSIPSLGEVIRQIRMYQTYTGADLWFIVSPDDRFAEQLRGQGIGFVKVPNTL